jgi:hypothetical protein
MTVDKSGGGKSKWPRNVPAYDLDLGTLMRLLKVAMAAKHVRLEGYWLDCPFECALCFLPWPWSPII